MTTAPPDVFRPDECTVCYEEGADLFMDDVNNIELRPFILHPSLGNTLPKILILEPIEPPK